MPVNISLITTLYNEDKFIYSFLTSIINQTVKPKEVIFVDGGSTDNTQRIINDFAHKHPELGVRLIIDNSCSRKFVAGPIARGRNVAIKNCLCNIIAATDAGCVLDPNWLKEISEPFQDSNVKAVAGWYISTRMNRFQRAYEASMMPAKHLVQSFDYLPSSRSVAFRKEVWEKVGGYPEDTHTAEDTFFCLNILRAGFQFHRAPSAFVQWECPSSWSELWKKHFSYGLGEGQLGLLKKKFLLRWLFLVFPVNFLRSPKKFLYFPIAYIGLAAHQFGYVAGLNRSKKEPPTNQHVNRNPLHKRIVFFSNRAAPFKGGVETHLNKLCRELSNAQVKNILVVSTTPSKEDGLIHAKKCGYEFYFVGNSASMLKKIFRGGSLNLLRKTIPAEIVHYHDFGSVLGYGLCTFLLRKLLRKNIYITFHGWEGIFPPKTKVKIVRKILAKLSNGTIQVGSFITKWYGTIADETIIGGVDFYSLQPEKSQNNYLPPEDCYFIGRLDADTGAQDVLSAWVDIVQQTRNKKGRLFVYGDGPLRAKIEAQINNDEDVSSRTVFCGFVEDPLSLVPDGAIVFTSGYLSILESFSRSARVISYYNHELKKDYLESIPGHENIMWCARSIAELIDCYFKASSDCQKNRAGALFAERNSWAGVRNVYLKLWSLTG